jgi:hypothetical protein
MIVAAFLMILGAPARAAAPSQPVLVAFDRCNSRMISDFESQIRRFDGRPAGNSPADLQKRYADIQQVLVGLNEEREILDNVCLTDLQKAPLFTQIATVAAYALALQADIAYKLGSPCAGAAKPMAMALLAQGWLDLANVVNADPPGTPVSGAVTQAAPRIQTRAATLGLTLPAYAETSSYWTDKITRQARDAVQACGPFSPEASPAPSPAASPTG